MKNLNFPIFLFLVIIIFSLAHSSWAMDPPEEASPIEAYKKLPRKEKKELFTHLGLRNAIIKEGGNIHPSSRQGVVWEKTPNVKCAAYNWKKDKGYSLSKTSHELKKSGLTSATAGAAYLGVGFDVEYESKDAMLNCEQEIEVYLLTTHNVATLELSMPTEHIKASPEFEEKIKKVLAGKGDITSYKDLIQIFKEYGFCVPTKFVLGGQIVSESTHKVKSVIEAKKAQKSLSASAQVLLFNTSGKAGVEKENGKEEERQEIHMLWSDKKYVNGGDGNLENNLKEWRRTLPCQIDKWRVIETGNFYPIIDFLDTEMQKKCLLLINTFYKDKSRPLSLEGMQFAINNNFSLLDALLEDISTGRLVIGSKKSQEWGTVCKRNKPISACYLQRIDGPGGKVWITIEERIRRLQGLKTLKVAKEKNYFLSLPIINALFEDISEGKLIIGTENSHAWGTVSKGISPISACYHQKYDGPLGKNRIKKEEHRIARLNNLNVLKSVKSEIKRCKNVLGESYPNEKNIL